MYGQTNQRGSPGQRERATDGPHARETPGNQRSLTRTESPDASSTSGLMGPAAASPTFHALRSHRCLFLSPPAGPRGQGWTGKRKSRRCQCLGWGFILSPSARTGLADLAPWPKVGQTVGCSTFTHGAKPATRRVADGERMSPGEGGASAPMQEDDEDLDDMHRSARAARSGAKSPNSGGQQRTALHSTTSPLAWRPGPHRQLVNGRSARARYVPYGTVNQGEQRSLPAERCQALRM